MEKTYQPDKIEAKWSTCWDSKAAFKPRGALASREKTQPYCITIPPPNVTGSLHLGHSFQDTLMDILIRYHRMQGQPTLWQMGTDHAGIATQMLVERQLLQTEKKDRHALGRTAFLEKMWAWKTHSQDRIHQQIKRLGASVDWSRACFSLDPAINQAVNTVFVQLYKEGLIYRGKRLVNWDPMLKTAISDLEVVNQTRNSHLWHIRYPLAGHTGQCLVVATTRPETLLGDVAVAVHPDDERYQQWLGKTLHLPLSERTIPVIADAHVDPTFGTGCVKITPAHDFNDYAIAQRHHLPAINLLTPDAHLNHDSVVPQAYRGLSVSEARKRIVMDLQAGQYIEKILPHTHLVPIGDRSGAVIEPYLTDQWFVRTKPLAEPAIAAVKTGKIRLHPPSWENTYFHWLHHIEDWCISRQLWWGHRIPAWYDENGQCYVGFDEATVRREQGLPEACTLRQDDDVLDTWFSAALWPFATLGWPQKTPTFDTFYPTDVLVTGFDILFFWVARMVMMGLKFTGDVPFRTVYITGLIRDENGQKMSKSKGNILDPMDLIDGITQTDLIAKRTQHMLQPALAEKTRTATRRAFPHGIPAHGTDALRFTLCALASHGRDINFDMQRLKGYRNFCNKLWNAARYLQQQTQQTTTTRLPCDILTLPAPTTLGWADRWIRSELQACIMDAHTAIAQYRFDNLAQRLHDFVWHRFCDWYLELIKPILQSEKAVNTAAQFAAQHTLFTVFDTLLKLLHPIIPFITEEIWHTLGLAKPDTLLMQQAFPQVNDQYKDPEAESEITWIQQCVNEMRNLRAENHIPPGKRIPLFLDKGTSTDRQRINTHQQWLMHLLKLTTLQWRTSDADDAHLSLSATAWVGTLQCCVPLADGIDKQTEKTRLKKQMAKLMKSLQRYESQLANPHYKTQAPQAVVAKTRQAADETKQALDKYQKQYEQLSE